jgi:1-acyl-sn-glycerol-3-phosphate acyltransferase
MSFNQQPPSKKEVEIIGKIFKPWEWLTSPTFYGLDNIPTSGPVLFVANHTIMGGLDVPLIWLKLYKEQDIFLRMLVDHAHFKVPVIREFLTKFGEVEGNRENAANLLLNNQYVLVFPGGAREAFKKKGEAYKLLWKDRIGFAQIAIQNNCPIVPLASVGPEECYDIIWDADDYLNSPIGKFIDKFGIRKDLLVPVVKGVGPTLLPKPQRFYFHFGEAIYTDKFERNDSVKNASELRDLVKDSLQKGIDFLKVEREKIEEKNQSNLKEKLSRFYPFMRNK